MISDTTLAQSEAEPDRSTSPAFDPVADDSSADSTDGGSEPLSGAMCDVPKAIPDDIAAELDPWVIELHGMVSVLANDVNRFADAVWAASPHDEGWADQEPVQSALALVRDELTVIQEFSGQTLRQAGFGWGSQGLRISEADQPAPGAIWYLHEGVWSSADYFQFQVLPNFLNTTGTKAVTDYYANGAITSGPCAMAQGIVEAVRYMIYDP
jgi:hypothetical protein